MVNGRTVLSSGEVCVFLLPPFLGPGLPPETLLLSQLLLWVDKGRWLAGHCNSEPGISMLKKVIGVLRPSMASRHPPGFCSCPPHPPPQHSLPLNLVPENNP